MVHEGLETKQAPTLQTQSRTSTPTKKEIKHSIQASEQAGSQVVDSLLSFIA